MKLGMVFEGGANRTVFSCGVMDAFLKERLMPDYLIGVSAGIAYGVSYLSGQKGRNIEVVENYIADKRYMGMRHLFNRNEKAYFNTKFVFEEVPNDASNIVSSRVRLSRNWEEYKFPSRLEPDEARTMIARLKQNFRDLGDRDGQFYEYEDLELMEKLDRTALRERRLLNPSQ